MILTLSSSFKTAYLGLLNNKGTLIQEELCEGFLQKNLLIALDHLLKSNSCTLNHIQFLVLDLGPGLFTSLRIGHTMIKTLQYWLKIPLIPMFSLDLIAKDFLPTQDPLVIAMDGKQSRFFMKIFYENQSSSIQDIPYKKSIEFIESFGLTIQECLWVGDYDPHRLNFKPKKWIQKTFSRIGSLNIEILKKTSLNWNQWEPFYGRQSIAEENYVNFRY